MADLDLMRDTAKALPIPDDPLAIRSLRVWHCRYRSLRDLARFENLAELEVAAYPDDTFDPLASLLHLERLRVVHMPRVTDLTPLTALARLQSLSLATLPSWDASGRVTEVRSLEPLGNLPALTEIELFGVVPPSRAVDELLLLPGLEIAQVSKYARGEAERLAAVLAAR
jgi:hypothetical protein